MNKPMGRFRFAVFVALMAGTTGQARASFTVESHWAGAFNGYYSTANGQQIADYFVMPSTSTVQAITWKGISINDGNQSDMGGVSSMDFKVRFYWDDESLPIQARLLNHQPTLEPFYEANVTASVSPTGNESFDHQYSLIQFSANLGAALALSAGQTYWISILGKSSHKDFSWALGAAGNGVFRTYPQPSLPNSDGTAWYENANLGHAHVVYSLSDSPLALPDPGPEVTPKPVPEPAPFALSCASIPIGLGYAWRRRRRARVAD